VADALNDSVRAFAREFPGIVAKIPDGVIKDGYGGGAKLSRFLGVIRGIGCAFYASTLESMTSLKNRSLSPCRIRRPKTLSFSGRFLDQLPQLYTASIESNLPMLSAWCRLDADASRLAAESLENLYAGLSATESAPEIAEGRYFE
jgi:hypothetical protein